MQQLTLIFEVLLLVAIAAGIFIGWHGSTKEDRPPR